MPRGADASIDGRTWIRGTQTLDKTEPVKTYTGRRIEKNAVPFAGLKINLFVNSSIPYDKYDKIIYKQTLSALEFELLATMYTARFDEYEETWRGVDENEARERLYQICEETMISDEPEAKIESEKAEFVDDGDSYKMTIEYECVVPIAQESRIFVG